VSNSHFFVFGFSERQTNKSPTLQGICSEPGRPSVVLPGTNVTDERWKRLRLSSLESRCYSTGDISGNSHEGGLIGYNDGDDITDCYSAMNVSGTARVGGLIGTNAGGTITMSYAKGDVSCEFENDGGLVGLFYMSIMTNCYSTGNVSGEELHVRVRRLRGVRDRHEWVID
jgi:hypothetical protein